MEEKGMAVAATRKSVLVLALLCVCGVTAEEPPSYIIPKYQPDLTRVGGQYTVGGVSLKDFKV